MFRKIRLNLLQIITTGLLLIGLVACSVPTGQTPRKHAPRPIEPVTISDEKIMQEVNQLKTPRRIRDDILRLHHDDPVKRAAAAQQLAKLGRGGAPAVPYLLNLLKDNTPVLLSRYLGGGFHSSIDTSPADEAARTLAKIGDPAIDGLHIAATSNDLNVRRLAIKALGQISDLSSIDILVNALNDENRKIQATAAIALGSYRHPIASQHLTERFNDLPASSRIHLVYAISQINDIIAVPFLIEQLAAQDLATRAAIVLALGKLRDARAIDVLIKSSRDEDEIIRANSVHALSSYYTPQVMEVLIEKLKDPSEQVKTTASESLATLTGLKFGTKHDKWFSWWQSQKQSMEKSKQSSQ